jgi:hypothetical protein
MYFFELSLFLWIEVHTLQHPPPTYRCLYNFQKHVLEGLTELLGEKYSDSDASLP